MIPLLRLRSDEQLVALFRAGHDEAFRVIHDRYRQRLFAYARQMLPRRGRTPRTRSRTCSCGLLGPALDDRELALRAWLFRVAHNRCIDELRRPAPPRPRCSSSSRAPSTTRSPMPSAASRCGG